MSIVTIEVAGENSTVVDEVTSTLLEQFERDGVGVKPPQTSGERDGGIIALVIAIAGGAASIAQVASTIHAMSKKKEVQIVIVDRSGTRTSLDPAKEFEEVQTLIREASSNV
ncbi:hypothetical protein [Stappia sp.]|uniref:hypothetical protein n=1 Tax=Stappia sp. TaxID=1870903 RepID=UPI003D0C1F5A